MTMKANEFAAQKNPIDWKIIANWKKRLIEKLMVVNFKKSLSRFVIKSNAIKN